MLLLCSNGLTCENLLDCVRQEIHTHPGKPRAALIVTGDPIYKEKNYHVPRCVQELESLGFGVDLFDLDKQPAQALFSYDCVELIGGNPYTLLSSLRKTKARAVLETLAANQLVIGWSAGAMVLGPTIALIDQFEPGMNSPELTDLTGIHLTNVQILPHYRQFLSRYEQLENRCQYYEKTYDCTVQRLNDGEGLMINPQNDRFVKIF
ncbi:Type 1 glutamine amidotransferase-like domain-containing protein [Holdemania filiformis]|uniref:Type 1 glutamine amidotransferase-like domain-containing protein n=1 Tax=Holdemania filiformis TaxID=61171 RepID=UPI00242F7373|nr:Type 1 glutamine amidotransferase-like domain-containing protein [Holdemania filiformis]